MATAEFSKFAGILSTALSQHHLLGFEKLKKGWKEYMKKLNEKDLNEPDYSDGVVSHSEPDILKCEVKWALGSITTHKASGSDGIPAELF